jgi:hypothetical protein
MPPRRKAVLSPYDITGLSLIEVALVEQASNDLLFAGVGEPDFWQALVDTLLLAQPQPRTVDQWNDDQKPASSGPREWTSEEGISAYLKHMPREWRLLFAVSMHGHQKRVRTCLPR